MPLLFAYGLNKFCHDLAKLYRLKINHIENNLFVNLPRRNLKNGGLYFLKLFYHLEILGWTSGFLEITIT